MSARLRVAFDVTSCAKPEPGGIGSYGRGLVRACARVGPEHEFRVAVRVNRWPRRHLVADLAGGRRVRLLTDWWSGRSLGRVDVLHAIGVRLPPRARYARVVTIHDLNVYENPELSSDDWRAKRRARIRETVQRADRVVSYSERGARSLREHLGLEPERIRVVPAGIDTDRFRPLDPRERDPVLRAYGLVDRPYLVSAGPLGPRKNQLGLLEAFAHADFDRAWQLVLVGPSGDQVAAVRARAEALGLDADRVVLPGRVPDGDLPALLGGSRGYVCASLHEGFGLPVAEAQACGVPVVSSDRGALPETVGDESALFDPADVGAFAKALRLLADEAAAAALARRGLEHARRWFSWDAVARRMLSVYEEVVRERRGPVT